LEARDLLARAVFLFFDLWPNSFELALCNGALLEQNIGERFLTGLGSRYGLLSFDSCLDFVGTDQAMLDDQTTQQRIEITLRNFRHEWKNMGHSPAGQYRQKWIGKTPIQRIETSS